MSIERIWHNLSVSEVIESLNSGIQGLTREEAERRLAQFGPNELAEKGENPPWMLFLEQFKSFLIIILLVAAIVSGVLALLGEGDILDPILIVIIVFFAAGLGFVQEYRSEKAMEALKQMAAPTATVIREGEEKEIPARELVPGDIILLETGDRIPADTRLIEAVNLKIGEAPLTGESVAVDKMTQIIPGDVPVADRRNMAYTGTTVVYGRGKAIVTGTGMATEFGKIAVMLQEVKAPPTPLQVNLDRTGKWIGIGALVLCCVLAGLGIMRGHGILEMFIWGVALAVAAVPEALPAVVTISLALGMQRMVKRHALLRHLPAVETLGCTTFICSDKTGTLTQNELTLRKIYVNDKIIDVGGVGYEPKGNFYLNGTALIPQDEPHLLRLLEAGMLCNDSHLTNINGVWQVKGDPTEGALVVVGAKAGIKREELTHPRISEVPFSSERKRMTTIHDTPQGKVAYSKGAPEVILSTCTPIYAGGIERELTEQDRKRILQVNQEMAAGALRILGLSYKSLPGKKYASGVVEGVEEEMVWLGLVGMIDPPREEVKQAVALCQQAGIESVMITGDHKLTAEAIAKELGILEEKDTALSGSELDKLTQAELSNVVERVKVYARVSPAHKMRVVEALQAKGHVVAMTGDGVNDAPALRKADIGIAMGITGTDVSKEAGAMILTDDNFASIVAAVEEGRGVFSNIKKYLMYLLSSNIGEILLMAGAILFGPLIGLPYGAIPLIAIQILYVNLATDGLPALALSVDPRDPDIMRQKPRRRGQGIFTKPVVTLMVIGGIWSCLVNLGIFKWALDAGRGMWEAQGLCFLTLVIIQFFKAYNFRSDRKSIFKVGMFKNKWLNLAICWEAMLLLIIIYTPFLQESFRTFSLSAFDWMLVILLAGTIFPVLEISKAVLRWQEKKGAMVSC
jgi:P-type Ca2+ transporter type 2C